MGWPINPLKDCEILCKTSCITSQLQQVTKGSECLHTAVHIVTRSLHCLFNEINMIEFMLVKNHSAAPTSSTCKSLHILLNNTARD